MLQQVDVDSLDADTKAVLDETRLTLRQAEARRKPKKRKK